MLKKVCNVLSIVILGIMLVVAALMIGPKFLGYTGYAVLSGSMVPEIPVGAIVYDKDADVADLEVGDVITYSLAGDTLVTHRITEIDIENQQVITKGDANDVEDNSPVPFSNIVGELAFTIPILGYISIYGKTKLGIGIGCAIIIILILVNYLPDVFEEDEDDHSSK